MEPKERLVSLDVFRGMTVAAMLLVNDPGTWSSVYAPLKHAKWHGWTPTDLVFPFFLFIVGVTTSLSLERRAELGAPDGEIRRRVVRRALLIFLWGLLVNAFPFFPLRELASIRIPGILQRIAICYLVTGLFTWKRSIRAHVVLVAILLVGYWILLTRIAPPGETIATINDPGRTMAAYFDRLLLGDHIQATTKTWDPEGPLSTISAVATCLLGAIAGRWLRRPVDLGSRLTRLAAAGALGVAAGLAWSVVFPINKNLWTSSYVLFTAGLAAAGIAGVGWLIDVRHWSRGIGFFRTFGLNPLVAFVGSAMLARLLVVVQVGVRSGETTSLHNAVYEHAFGPFLPPRIASLAYAALYVLLWYVILRILERRGLILKV
ncbi:MAG: heparan-alpha-glucosaminide N-acetyltransferase domain-containing protein [Gemmatimonadota bacterium]